MNTKSNLHGLSPKDNFSIAKTRVFPFKSKSKDPSETGLQPQTGITCSQLTIETPEQNVKYVQS